MMLIYLRVRAFLLCAVMFVLASIPFGWAQISVTTWHYDNARLGANSNETILTPENVSKTQFGKLFTQPVDGAVVGQALYLPGITIPRAGVHNVAYVATMNDSVYAFDADSATGNNAKPLWHANFRTGSATAVPIGLQGCGTVTEWKTVGILSTPVIDPVAGTIFVVAKTYENSTFVHRLHALDITTGLEKTGSPVVITASYQYAGNNNVFADKMQVNRPALLLEKGNLYIAFGSNGCRGDTEEGWVVSYNASTLQPEGVFDDEPGEAAAGIWMRGGGLSADTAGHIFGATADGPFTPGLNFGQSVFKLSQGSGKLVVTDWFTPYNELILDKEDMDMSEPVMVLPQQSGKYPSLLAAVGKEGTIYILNRNSMGHFCGQCTKADTQIVQEARGFAPNTGALVYWNDAIYTTGQGSPVAALSFTNGILGTTPFAKSSQSDSGHSPVISANGNTDGILWQINGSNLTAYDAVTLATLYSSGQSPNQRDLLPTLPHVANLIEANGKVYVGTNNSLVVFGVL